MERNITAVLSAVMNLLPGMYLWTGRMNALGKHSGVPVAVRLSKKSHSNESPKPISTSVLAATAKRNKSIPVRIHYKVGSSRFEKSPDDYDLGLLERISKQPLPGGPCAVKVNFQDPPWGDFYRAGYHAGMTHVHHFFTPRNLRALFLAS